MKLTKITVFWPGITDPQRRLSDGKSERATVVRFPPPPPLTSGGFMILNKIIVLFGQEEGE
jgi:hypothetical protein